MGSSHMFFSGEAGCPVFSPNAFKADICKDCQNKIQTHSGASELQVSKGTILLKWNVSSEIIILKISAALEFSVDSVPSLGNNK